MWKLPAALALISAVAISAASAQQGGGMMMQPQGPMPNLKEPSPEQQVKAVRYCEGEYYITTGAGDILQFPEFNLRFKTDFGEMGPAKGAPALLPAGMMGDRAFLIFAVPDEISGFIKNAC